MTAFAVITLLSSRTMALASSSLTLLVDVERHPELSISLRLVLPFSNVSVRLYTLLRERELSPLIDCPAFGFKP